MTSPRRPAHVPDGAQAAAGPPSLIEENAALRERLAAQQVEIDAAQRRVAELAGYESHWRALTASPAWQLVQTLQSLRAVAAPSGSRRAELLARAGRLDLTGLLGTARRATGEWADASRRGRATAGPRVVDGRLLAVEPVRSGTDADAGLDAGLSPQDARLVLAAEARAAVAAERADWLRRGRAGFAGRRLLFLLPIEEQVGGANVVIHEAMAMRAMGVEVTLFNIDAYRASFLAGYPDLALPVIFGDPADVAALARDFDAVVATACASFDWLPETAPGRPPVAGYYVQGFEPYLFPPGSARNEQAWASYTRRPEVVRFTKSAWNRDELRRRAGAAAAWVGPSVSLDLFRARPRPAARLVAPERPDAVRVAAMVRPLSDVRQPGLTMHVLRELAERHGDGVELVIFGARPEDPWFLDLPRDFRWTLAGLLTPAQVAALLNEVDVFADFSLHQAMGLTALEAMATGVAVVVPRYGGSVEFVRDGENGLVVDTTDATACSLAVSRLVDTPTLRRRLGDAALRDACQYYVEAPAFRALEALFGPGADGDGAGR